MKKFISKVKKVMSAAILSIISFPSKIIAMSSRLEQDLYGPPVPLYGPPESEPSIILKIARTFIIPIALLVGIIVYLKKSKSSKKKKILVTLGIIAITVVLYIVIGKIIYG